MKVLYLDPAEFWWKDCLFIALSDYLKNSNELIHKKNLEGINSFSHFNEIGLVVSEINFPESSLEETVKSLNRIKERLLSGSKKYLPLVILANIKKEELPKYNHLDFDLLVQKAFVSGNGKTRILKEELASLIENPYIYHNKPKKLFVYQYDREDKDEAFFRNMELKRRSW